MNKGIKYALITAVISGAANFLNKELLTGGMDPVLMTWLKNIIAGLFLLAILGISFKNLKPVNGKNWLKIILIALIGGSVPFVLFFQGLAQTSAVTGSLIHKTMFVWVAILCFFLYKEKPASWQIFGMFVMALGTIMLNGFKSFSLGQGEIMVMAATLIWSAEVILVKKYLNDIDFKVLAAGRLFIGSFFILGYGLWAGKFSAIGAVTPATWFKLTIVGAVLASFVFFWYRSLSFLSAGAVTSLLTLAFPITIIFTRLKTFSPFTLIEFSGLALAILGALTFIKTGKTEKKLCQLPQN